jgi:integrase
MVTHSREYALDDREFELFVEGARRIDCDLRSLESQFLAFVGGRLGLRPGEICHMEDDWINWRRRMIEIPLHEPCDKGKDGGICGYCRQNAEQRVEYNSLSLAEARLEVLRAEMGPHLPRDLSGKLQAMHRAAVDGDLEDEFIKRQLTSLLESAETAQDADVLLEAIDETARRYQSEQSIDMGDAREMMWRGKTENAARKVPFDWHPRTEIIIERFFDRFDHWPESFSTIGRRVDDVLQEADELGESSTTPHGLRATAASRAAASGMTPLAMRSMFGWSSISTAKAYVSDSPENTQRQLHQAYSR